MQLYNNEECYADRVISACDGHNTLFGLIDRQYFMRSVDWYRRTYSIYLTNGLFKELSTASFTPTPARWRSLFHRGYANEQECYEKIQANTTFNPRAQLEEITL